MVENTNGGIFILLNFLMSIKVVFMVLVHQEMNFIMEVNSMKYSYLVSNKNNSFYPVSLEEIEEVEETLDLKIPKELKDFFLNVGYGFIKGSKYNINRIMDPYSIRDFRLKQNDYEFFQILKFMMNLKKRLSFLKVAKQP